MLKTIKSEGRHRNLKEQSSIEYIQENSYEMILDKIRKFLDHDFRQDSQCSVQILSVKVKDSCDHQTDCHVYNCFSAPQMEDQYFQVNTCNLVN